MILPVCTSKMVSQPVKSFQVSVARYWPLGLMDEDRRRPWRSSTVRVPIGLIHCWVGSRIPLAYVPPTCSFPNADPDEDELAARATVLIPVARMSDDPAAMSTRSARLCS